MSAALLILIWLFRLCTDFALDSTSLLILDYSDIFGLKGVYRKGKQKGTGNIILEVDATADSTYIFPTTTEIAASNGKKYLATENTLLIDNVSSFRLDRANIQIGVEYNAVLTDTTDGVQYPWTYTASDDADRDEG